MNDWVCNECSAALDGVQLCREYLDEMIKWDFEDFIGVGQIHHLTVLSYNLQHPSVYSKRGLDDARESFRLFLASPEAFKAHDLRNRKQLASNVRDWKITGTPEDHGEYVPAPVWKMRASDVVKGGLSNYVENVKKWADSIAISLRGR